jgi:hypothetical protein
MARRLHEFDGVDTGPAIAGEVMRRLDCPPWFFLKPARRLGFPPKVAGLFRAIVTELKSLDR